MSEDIKEVMQELYGFNFRISILHKILSIDFSRCFEYSHAIQETESKEGMNILDIGATHVSFFPLFVSNKGAKVTLIDIDTSVYQLKQFAKKVGCEKNIKTLVCDAQKMEFPDDTFDLLYAISTIEHIPFDGDIISMKEISRVLKYGGKAIVTVPYGRYEESTWDKCFFRVYDYEVIGNRLIKSSKLQVEKIVFHEIRKYESLQRYCINYQNSLDYPLDGHIFSLRSIDKYKACLSDAGLAIIFLSKKLG